MKIVEKELRKVIREEIAKVLNMNKKTPKRIKVKSRNKKK